MCHVISLIGMFVMMIVIGWDAGGQVYYYNKSTWNKVDRQINKCVNLNIHAHVLPNACPVNVFHLIVIVPGDHCFSLVPDANSLQDIQNSPQPHIFMYSASNFSLWLMISVWLRMWILGCWLWPDGVRSKQGAATTWTQLSEKQWSLSSNPSVLIGVGKYSSSESDTWEADPCLSSELQLE